MIVVFAVTLNETLMAARGVFPVLVIVIVCVSVAAIMVISADNVEVRVLEYRPVHVKVSVSVVVLVKASVSVRERLSTSDKLIVGGCSTVSDKVRSTLSVSVEVL